MTNRQSTGADRDLALTQQAPRWVWLITPLWLPVAAVLAVVVFLAWPLIYTWLPGLGDPVAEVSS